MLQTIRVYETEEIIIYKEYHYGPEMVSLSKKFFNDMKEEGIIVKGSFEGDEWVCFNGTIKKIINFNFDKQKYDKHIGNEFGISYKTMKLMLKCYAAYCTGEYIFATIAKEIIGKIEDFLCGYKERDFALTETEKLYIRDFLAFITTPQNVIDEIASNIANIKVNHSKARKLSHLINYLVIENEINKMFDGDISDEDFIKYFPIYFWINITFILPLRPTEMLVTPYDCIDILENEIVLRVRRTLLKGGNKRVHNEVEMDYGIFTYHLENLIKTKVFEKIKKYQELTKNHNRKFLFDYGKAFSNNMFSLQAFNNLIKVFMDEKVIGNPQYAYAKRVCNIEDFAYVQAGDSRPIAMSNLYLRGASMDLCRQLANHMNISTSEGYISNISETFRCSSIMKMQIHINEDFKDDKVFLNKLLPVNKYGCSNPKNLKNPEYIEDCKGHHMDCYGCIHYCVSDKEIREKQNQRKKELEDIFKMMQKALASNNKIKGKDIDMNELFLKVHTACARYKESSDVYARQEAIKWVEEQNSKKI